ncbi:MAG TPA: helix-turn-helix transcriptional regulator [Solirubrobacterales bacterium]|nr:helix-turn-helix transcriptional regulator [Solirubrobacterales bacterium]
MSSETLRILGVMLEDPMAWHYGLGLSDEAKIASGTIYPMLARLEKAGWLESKWEEQGQGQSDVPRPRRRLYRLTGHGERAALPELEEIARVAGRVRRKRLARGSARERLA